MVKGVVLEAIWEQDAMQHTSGLYVETILNL